jgi:hypothetical protein
VVSGIEVSGVEVSVVGTWVVVVSPGVVGVGATVVVVSDGGDGVGSTPPHPASANTAAASAAAPGVRALRIGLGIIGTSSRRDRARSGSFTALHYICTSFTCRL